MEKDEGCYFHEATFIDQEGNPRTTRVPVVQELARQGLTHLPERFMAVHPNDPIQPPNAHMALPSINVAKLRVGSDPEDRAQELARLAGVANQGGIFLIAEHGISNSALHGIKEAVKGFFGLSFEEKKRSVGSYGSADNMGYGRNFVKSEDQALDWIDRLAMIAAPEGGDGGLNVWPQHPANFKEAIQNYVAEARTVLDELLQALAEALSLQRQAFLKDFDPDQSEIKLRINYYPPCPRPDLALGITPHTDPSGLTLLTQFDAGGGLQILHDGKWLTVAWPEDALLVNTGDLLEISSNGRVKSPWHRVVTQMNTGRISVALFYNPPSWAELEPEPVKDPNAESKGGYKKVVVRDYLKHFYKLSPTNEKLAIMYAMV